jgi:radical SAM protein with 4Fe4S-binding SPASM domain
MITELSTPKIIQSAFYAKKKEKYLIMNPDVPNWIVVNENAAYFLSCCNGKRSIREIFETIKTNGNDLGIKSVLKLFQRAADSMLFEHEFRIYKSSVSEKVDRNDYSPKPLRSVHLKLTNKCNLKCTYCYAESGLCTSSPILSLDELKRVADEIREFSSPVDYTFSGGEPLMHPYALEFAEYITTQGNRCSLLTNGAHINKKNVDRISSLFSLIKISLDGSSEEINSKTRGFNSYLAVLKAYNLLVEKDANVFINMTVSKTNLSDIQNMVDLFGARLNFQPLFKAGRGKEYDENGITGDEYYKVLAAAKNVKPMSKIEKMLTDLKGKGTTKCPLADGDISISETGNIYPCQMLHENKFCGGNVKKKSIADIYNSSSTFKSLRKLVVDNIDGCSSCPIRRLCGGSCRARSYHETGNIWDTGEFCDYERQSYINGIFNSSVF